MAKTMRIYILLAVLSSFLLFLLAVAKAANFGFLVQHIEIDPKVAELGDTVNITFVIKNS